MFGSLVEMNADRISFHNLKGIVGTAIIKSHHHIRSRDATVTPDLGTNKATFIQHSRLVLNRHKMLNRFAYAISSVLPDIASELLHTTPW